MDQGRHGERCFVSEVVGQGEGRGQCLELRIGIFCAIHFEPHAAVAFEIDHCRSDVHGNEPALQRTAVVPLFQFPQLHLRGVEADELPPTGFHLVVGDGFGNLRHLVQKVVNRRRPKVEHGDLLNVTTRHLELHPRRRGIQVGCFNLPKRVPSLPHRLLFYLGQLDLLAADRWIVLR